MRTQCLSEAKYELRRAILSRGFTLLENNREFIIGSTFGHFALSFLPGNRRILVSHGVFIKPEYRHKGYGKKYLKIRDEIAVEAGINLLLATVRNDNEIEVKLLKKFKWTRIINRKSTGTSMWRKYL